MKIEINDIKINADLKTTNQSLMRWSRGTAIKEAYAGVNCNALSSKSYIFGQAWLMTLLVI